MKKNTPKNSDLVSYLMFNWNCKFEGEDELRRIETCFYIKEMIFKATYLSNAWQKWFPWYLRLCSNDNKECTNSVKRQIKKMKK